MPLMIKLNRNIMKVDLCLDNGHFITVIKVIILRSRKMITDEEYKRILKQFHKLSDRHILAAETDMSSSDIQKDNMK